MCQFSRDVIEGGGVTATPKELEEVLLHDLKSVNFGNVNFKVEAGQEEDVACEKFRLRVARAGDQVIRFVLFWLKNLSHD